MAANLVDASRRELGASALRVGPVAFGCWRFTHVDVDRARFTLEAALDAGMSLVDTADVYGLDWGGSGFGANEELLGRVLGSSPGLRSRMVLATKGGIRLGVPYDSSASALRAACDDSLRRLRTDVIDVYQVHRPDVFTHPEEVAGALVSLREAGKILEAGVSNYTATQTEALARFLPFPLATIQPEWSVLQLAPLRDGVLDLVQRDSLTPLAWSPLAGGRVVSGSGVSPALTGVLDDLARREGVDRAAVALAFILAHPSRPVVVVGTQQPDRLRAAAAAATVSLDRGDCYRIIEASDGEPLP
jgi:aryl-alcohol dehydrogenase-like predicted oxidoreductase